LISRDPQDLTIFPHTVWTASKPNLLSFAAYFWAVRFLSGLGSQMTWIDIPVGGLWRFG
jgi:hypothetical protein